MRRVGSEECAPTTRDNSNRFDDNRCDCLNAYQKSLILALVFALRNKMFGRRFNLLITTDSAETIINWAFYERNYI